MGPTPQLQTAAVHLMACGGQTRPTVAELTVEAFQHFCVERINESCLCFSVSARKNEFISLFSLLTSQINTGMKFLKFTLPLVYN